MTKDEDADRILGHSNPSDVAATREQNEAILLEAGRLLFAAINKVLTEELRDHPAILRRIHARLIGLDVSPKPTKKPWSWRHK